MKKRLFFLSILSLLMVVSSKQTATASACSSTENYGVLSLSLPELPRSGTYNIWTRMQAPDATHNRYRLEVNGQECYEVGGSSITPGQWVWVSFKGGDLTQKVRHNFEEVKGNKIRLIGSDSGVKVDRLLLVKNDCIPENLGNNCQSDAVPASAVQAEGASEVPPPSSGPVSGIVIPSTSISLKPSLISKVVYFSDGKAVPTAAGNGIDTTLLSNGSHRVSMHITRTDGTVLNEATTLNVENKQGAFSPLRRYIRLHTQAFIIWSLLLGGLLFVLVILLGIRHIKLQKRLLNFHGF